MELTNDYHIGLCLGYPQCLDLPGFDGHMLCLKYRIRELEQKLRIQKKNDDALIKQLENEIRLLTDAPPKPRKPPKTKKTQNKRRRTNNSAPCTFGIRIDGSPIQRCVGCQSIDCDCFNVKI